MTNEIKKYIIYFIKSNRRVLILESVLLFIALPFLIYNQIGFGSFLFNNGEKEYYDLFIKLIFMVFLCTYILGFVFPIYINRFLFKRQSCDLYFALPIKRGKLFLLQYVLGSSLALVPLFVNMLLALIVFNFQFSGHVLLLLECYGIAILTFYILYTMVNFIVIKCNNLMDAIVISGAYHALPILIIFAIFFFLQSQVFQAFVGQGFNVTGIFHVEIIAGLLSLPAVSVYEIGYILTESTFHMMEPAMLLGLYWILIGIACFYFGKKSFENRKEESAEQRTTAYGTYPLIIMLVVTSFVLLIFTNVTNLTFILTMTIIVFILYAIMIFFANRKIRLRIRDVMFFVLIFICTWGISTAFNRTGGFGLLKELPVVEKIESVEVEIYLESSIVDGEEINNENFKNYSVKLKGENKINEVLDLQSKFMHDDGTSEVDDWRGSVEFIYSMKGDTKEHRQYNIYNTALYQYAMNLVKLGK